jgi:biotin synthase
VLLRGLIEFSNECANDCLYCGIRRSNAEVERYCLTSDEVVEAALFAAVKGFGSVVLQSGERHDEALVSFVEDVVRRIKRESTSAALPQGLGVTLSVGEQSRESYERFFRAGAHRYLLRIETSSPVLYRRLHPARQSFEERVRCLRLLKEIGYQVGTGVMIGLPGQTVEQLADDILFFRDIDADMIGMGPYIVHHGTPMVTHEAEVSARKAQILQLSLNMIAVTRLVLKDVNIASTTALQAMHPEGRELGLSYGANVIMPQVTPSSVRRHYLLYDGKPCVTEDSADCAECVAARVLAAGRSIAWNAWGDSRHALARSTQPS